MKTHTHTHTHKHTSTHTQRIVHAIFARFEALSVEFAGLCVVLTASSPVLVGDVDAADVFAVSAFTSLGFEDVSDVAAAVDVGATAPVSPMSSNTSSSP